MLLNEPSQFLVSHKYDGKILAIELSDGNVDYEFKNRKIYINVTLDAEIVENMPEFDLRKNEVYKKIEEDFSKRIASDLEELINLFVQNNTDAVGFENLYYKKYRQQNPNILQKYDVEINVKVSINKKGLIYEVDYE